MRSIATSLLVLASFTGTPALAGSSTTTIQNSSDSGVATREWDKSVTREDGTRTVTSSATGPKGNTISQSRTAVRGDEGWTSSGEWATSTGQSGTTSGYARKTDDGRAHGRAIQSSDGTTLASRDVRVSRADGLRTRTVETKGRQRPNRKPR